MTNEPTERSTADAMSPDEYRTTIEALALTQAGAARLLGVDGRTSRKWAAGDREVPPTAARFLRFLLAAKISPDEVMKALAADAPAAP